MRLDWGDQFPGKLPTVRDPLAGIASTLDITGKRITAATKPVEPKGVFSYPTNSSSINRRPSSYYGWVLPPDDLIILSESTGTVSEISGNGIIVTDSLGNTHYQDIDPLYTLSVAVSSEVTAGVTTVATLSTEADTELLPTVELDEVVVSESLSYYYVNVLLERGPRIRVRVPAGTTVNAYDPIIAYPSATGDWIGFIGGGRGEELIIRHFELKTALEPIYAPPPEPGMELTETCDNAPSETDIGNGLPESWMEWNALNERFVLGGCAMAHRINLDPKNEDGIPVGEPITNDPDMDFKVHDWLGQFRGRGRGTFEFPYHRGSRGVAVWVPKVKKGYGEDGKYGLHRGKCCADCREYDPEDHPEEEEKYPTREREDQEGQWHITQLTPAVSEVIGVLVADYTSGETLAMTQIVIVSPDGAIFVDSDPSNQYLTVANPFNMTGSAGGYIKAKYIGRTKTWIAIQVQCPPPVFNPVPPWEEEL